MLYGMNALFTIVAGKAAANLPRDLTACLPHVSRIEHDSKSEMVDCVNKSQW